MRLVEKLSMSVQSTASELERSAYCSATLASKRASKTSWSASFGAPSGTSLLSTSLRREKVYSTWR